MKKNVYGYVRVSTKRQGNGVSLEVQQRDILAFAQNNNLNIEKWFIEKKSASKGYRPQFHEMMASLFNGKSEGFIAHKIDRMQRNRMDWANINVLIDRGQEIHSVSDGIDFTIPAGRFIADIHAAQSTNYSLNLSFETKKGLYGRLKQGYYPFLAPLGYIDNGGGEMKTIDPIKAPLIKKLFELYSKQGYSIRTLVIKMYELGLRNTRGSKLSKNSIIKILKNTFYTGIMEVKGQQFKGNHTALITMRTYKKVQDIMSGKANTRIRKHNFLFRKMLRCKTCNYRLVGELQKGNVYYRCHTKKCPTKSIREHTINVYVDNMLKSIQIQKEEESIMSDILMENRKDWLSTQQKLLRSYSLRIGQLQEKLQRIRDLLINGDLNKEEYELEKQKILAKQQELNEQKNVVSTKKTQFIKKMHNFLELAKTPMALYDSANLEEKRELLENLTLNLFVEGKRVMFSMVSPFYALANRDILMSGGPIHTTTLQKENTICYESIMTSPILPTAMDDKKCREFFDYLLEETASLPDLNLSHQNEIPTNHPSTE